MPVGANACRHFFRRGQSRSGLLDDGVEAVGLDALAHGFGFLLVGEGADLDVEELVLGLMADDYGVAVFFEGGDFDVGDVLAGDGGDLNHEGASGGGSRCAGSGRGSWGGPGGCDGGVGGNGWGGRFGRWSCGGCGRGAAGGGLAGSGGGCVGDDDGRNGSRLCGAAADRISETEEAGADKGEDEEDAQDGAGAEGDFAVLGVVGGLAVEVGFEQVVHGYRR